MFFSEPRCLTVFDCSAAGRAIKCSCEKRVSWYQQQHTLTTTSFSRVSPDNPVLHGQKLE